MIKATLSVLLATGVTLAGVAHAQEAPPAPAAFAVHSDRGNPHWFGDPWSSEPSQAMRRSLGAGIAALKVNDFTKAEAIFNENLRDYGSNPRFRFYMGVAKMNLGKWSEARRYLRAAARAFRRSPDPIGYLGVTYAKLGNIGAANAERARLMRMARACMGTCELSPNIASGIQMIDKALAEAPNSSDQG